MEEWHEVWWNSLERVHQRACVKLIQKQCILWAISRYQTVEISLQEHSLHMWHETLLLKCEFKSSHAIQLLTFILYTRTSIILYTRTSTADQCDTMQISLLKSRYQGNINMAICEKDVPEHWKKVMIQLLIPPITKAQIGPHKWSNFYTKFFMYKHFWEHG